MTIVEKAAYLKGLTDGLGVDPETVEGKLWSALNDLLSDIAHEIEDLQATDLDHAEALDDISEELEYLEDLTADLDEPEEYDGEDGSPCAGCPGCGGSEDWDDEDEDEDESYDGIVYDVTCPVCGEEISFDEETLDMGSIKCPSCGETLEFDLDGEEDGD